jgi:hypothetical protein
LLLVAYLLCYRENCNMVQSFTSQFSAAAHNTYYN